jgi:hypothetical protein
MKLSHVLQKMLTNKTVLNIVCVLSALNMIGYLVMNNFTAILFFIVLAILIVQFNKNMIIVLGIPLILVNLFVAAGISKNIEGNENMSDTKKKEEAKKDEGQKKDSIKKKDDKDKISKQGLPITPIEPTDTSTDTTTDESFEVGRAKRRGAGSEIDYAATVEGAYDQLNSILGSEGIKRLTGDTQKLMKQQMQLAESMKGMGPMIKNLEPMMNQAKQLLGGMGDGEGGMANIMEMAKQFGGSLNK